MFNIFFVLVVLCFSNTLFSKPFANSFLEFNLPDTWECAPYSDDWTCQPVNPDQKKEAIVVLTTRTQKAGDNLQNYFTLLGQPMATTDTRGRTYMSKPSYTQYKEIFGNTWVDSQHNSSELPGFVTRYLAATKNGRSILVSVTVHESRYAMYMADLYKMIESMKIRMSLPSVPTETGVADLLGQRLANMPKKVEQKKVAEVGLLKPDKRMSPAVVALIVGGSFALIALLIMRIRKNKKKRKGYLK